MRAKYIIFLLTPLIVLTLFAPSPATVEWNILVAFQIEKAPLDMAVSSNGKYVYVLSDEGVIYIYTSNGELKDKMSVGKTIDGIKAGPREDILFISSSKNKRVQIITLDFLQNINISGAPFKGPADARVVVAVFNDFQ